MLGAFLDCPERVLVVEKRLMEIRSVLMEGLKEGRAEE